MSDEKQPPKPPKAKTTTVPLKKETVRISLKSKPGAAPPAPGGAKPPAPKPAAPKAPGAPKPAVAPKPAAAPKAPAPKPAAAAPKPAVAPKPGAPKAPAVAVGEKTVPVKVAAAPVGKTTQQVKPAAKKSLPKATVNLKKADTPSRNVTITTGDIADDDRGEESNITPFALLAALLAAVVFGLQLMRYFA